MKINKAQTAQTAGHGVSLSVIGIIYMQFLVPMQAEIDELQNQLVQRCEIVKVKNEALAADETNLSESARDVANRYISLSENEPLSQTNQLRLEQKLRQEQQFKAEEVRLLGLAEAACDG